MAEYLVRDFFPATSTLITSHFPTLWKVAFPPSLKAIDVVPDLHIYPSLPVRWPLLVPLCAIGMVLSAMFATRLMWAYTAACASYEDRYCDAPAMKDECRKLIPGTTPTPGVPLVSAQTTTSMLMWAQAYIWYGLMCASAMVYHCFHPLPFFRSMDMLCTSFSSISIIFAMSTRQQHKGCPERMYALYLAFIVMILLLVFGHPLVQEQLYLFPTSIAVGLVGSRMVILARKGYHRVRIFIFTGCVLISCLLSRSQWMRVSSRNNVNFVVLGFMWCDISLILIYLCLDVKTLPIQKIRKR